MKLIFDATLSPALVIRLADILPGSVHVFEIGEIAADDLKSWLFAGHGDFVLVSQDTDFIDLCLLRGPPPKLVLLRIGNCSTGAIERVIRARHADILRFGSEFVEMCLIVDR